MANNSFKVKNSLVLTPKDLSTLVSPEAGDLACDINDNNKIKRYDANAAAWVEVGSGGVGGVDIFFVQDFESASLSSFTQTGLSLSQTNPLKGKVSAGLTHQAGTSPTNDQFFTQIIPVDRKFRGQLMSFALNVRSTASPGNLVLKVRDVTNSSDIIVSEQIQTSSNPFTANTSSGSPTLSNISNADMALLQIGEAVSGSGIPTGAVITALGTNQVTISANASATATGVSLRASSLPARRTFSFKIPESCASLSYTITALPEANSPRSIIDDIICELSESALLETSVEVPNVTSWQGYTPTFQGFGTPTNVEFEWRQVGENVEIRGKFTSGTTTAVEARVGLPAGLTSAGTSLIPSIQLAGTMIRNINAASPEIYSILIEPNVSYLTYGYSTSSINPFDKRNGSDIVAGNILSFFASVPCAGLSATSTKTIPLTQSGLVQNPDSMIRLIGQNGYGATNTKIQRFSTLVTNLGSSIQYTDSATLGASFTLLESGIYDINFSYDTVTGITHGLSVNTTQPTTNIQSVTDGSRLSYTANGNGLSGTVSYSGYFNAGDIVRAHGNGGAVASIYNFSISKQSSLKQVSVSSDQKITIPTSELRMEGASTRGSTATAIVRFDNIAKIRGDAFTVESDAVLGTRIVMKKAGRLSIDTSIVLNNGRLSITKNQANLTAIPSSASELLSTVDAVGLVGINASYFGDFAVGDIIRVSTNVAPSSNVVNQLNLSFQEQDIAVSVTNTLPQFSESDSSVRVDTANGYGSFGTKIRRFSNVRDNIGGDIEYVPSAVNGDSFVVKSSGVYNISYTDLFTGAENLGITKNAETLSGGIATVSASNILATSTTGAASLSATASWEGYLVAGDIIRPQTGGTAGTTNGTIVAKFTISKVGKPNVTGVDVTPFVNLPQPDLSEIRFEGASTRGGTATAIVRFDSNTRLKGSGLAVTSDATNGTVITVLKAGRLSLSATIVLVNGRFSITRNQATLTALTTVASEILSSAEAAGTVPITASTVTDVVVGDVIRISSNTTPLSNAVNNFTATLTAASDQILTAPETFSTDTAALQYASSSLYNLTTLANAPVGTYITFTYAANTNTRTQTTTRPTQTDADMNANGLLVYARAYNAPSSAAQPAAFAIQIGKGLKGLSLSGYSSTAKTNGVNLDYFISGSVSLGARIKSYNESTGILYLDAAYNSSSITSAAWGEAADLSNPSSAYIVINASKSPALTGVPLLQPRIATIKDIKTSGTQGGSSIATTIFTRTLNTLDDPTGIVTSLASNQFALPAGSYFIEADVPSFRSSFHTARLRNITDGTTTITGVTGYSDTASGQSTDWSKVVGYFTIASAKTFEIQHYTTTARATDGLGISGTTFGEPVTYTQVKITKVK